MVCFGQDWFFCLCGIIEFTLSCSERHHLAVRLLFCKKVSKKTFEFGERILKPRPSGEMAALADGEGKLKTHRYKTHTDYPTPGT